MSIIRSLNSNKAHGWDGISIRMIEMCDESITPPIKIIFDNALKSGIYPDKWKRAKRIYNSLYSYLESNNILSKSQSGFCKGDSCISQLLAITHEIYSNFDICPSLCPSLET